MVILNLEKKDSGIKPSPWLVMGSVTILFTIVIILAFQNINRERLNMSRILMEKGASLIKSFEAGARTGMSGPSWGRNHMQRLLEEMAKQEDILYLIMTERDGNIIAHNERSKIGENIGNSSLIKGLSPDLGPQWRLAEYGKDQRVFEVYAFFQPLSPRQGERIRGLGTISEGRAGLGENSAARPALNETNRIIFVGLDIGPFDQALREDIKNTIIISAVLIILGFGGLISLYWAQGYRSARKSLQDTSAFADRVVTDLPVGLIATDREGKIQFFNSAAENITQISHDDAAGRFPVEILPHDLLRLIENSNDGETVIEKEMECSFSDSAPVPLSISAARIINKDGETVGNILILRDLTEVQRLQNEIRQKEKLASLGSLASGVAHEIRNPLSSIKGMASYFGHKFPVDSEDREAADVIVREVDRMDRVISELLYYSRPSELDLKLTDLNDLLADSVRLVNQDALTKSVDIRWKSNRDLPKILLDPDRFSQCLLNLYLNSIQAMDKGGVLSIQSFLIDDSEIEIEVADTGKGMSPDEIKNIFNPYFTTKPSGTGLGLAIVQKIIEAHNGRIGVRSTPGKGTIFSINIPLKTRLKGVEHG